MDSVKPLVYLCVFFNRQYITLLKLLLTSVKLYSKFENLTFLVLTQEKFREEIQSVSSQIGIPLKIHTHEVKDMFDAAASKCRIFEYPEINNYTHILYLDTDIIIKDDLTKLVENIQEEKLYGMEEGVLSHPGNGGWFFSETQQAEISKAAAINTGVLLFKNTKKIRQVMTDCNTFMTNRNNSGEPMPCCLEQPFINYYFYKEHILDTKYLQKYVILCGQTFNEKADTNYMIYHFYAPIGDSNSKLIRMRSYLSFSQKKPVNNTFAANPIFTWNDGCVQFNSDNTMITTWGEGTYNWQDTNLVSAIFGNYTHNIYFENSFTSFLSVRNEDCDIVRGNLIKNYEILAVSPSNVYDEEQMKYLLESSKKNNFKVEIIGLGKKFTWLDRIIWFKDYLTALPTENDQIVCFTDAYDVFYATNLEIIKKKFLEFKTDIVWSVEKWFYHQIETDRKFYDDLCPSSYGYKYINGGTFIGYKKSLLELFTDIIDNSLKDCNFINELNSSLDKYINPIHGNDQSWISHHLAKNWKKYKIKLDYNCDIFYLPCGDWDNIEDYISTNYVHLKTGKTPCIFHVPLKSVKLHILDKLFKYKF